MGVGEGVHGSELPPGMSSGEEGPGSTGDEGGHQPSADDDQTASASAGDFNLSSAGDFNADADADASSGFGETGDSTALRQSFQRLGIEEGRGTEAATFDPPRATTESIQSAKSVSFRP